MPLLIHAAWCWIAGAFLGSAESLDRLPLPLLVLICALVGVVQARFLARDDARSGARGTAVVTATALALLAVTAAAEARRARRAAADCRDRLGAVVVHGGALRVALDDRVAAGGSARGVARGEGPLASCEVPVTLRATTGRAPPGRWMQVTGTTLVTARGLRLTGSLTPVSPVQRDWRRAARGRVGEVIDRDFGANAPLVRALLIADQDGIDPAVRDRFADAGLVHMLSISGLHVAIIAGALLTLCGALRLSRTLAFGASMVVIVLYVAMLGAPAPAVRSAVMLGVVGLSERLQRPTHPWTALALGAVIPAWQPVTVLDLGWQLSVSGMAALVAARAMLRRVRTAERRHVRGWRRRALGWYQRLDGWRYGVARELVTGTVATLVTAPLIAWTFGRVSLIAPLSNVAAGPLVAFIQPALFLAVLSAPWPGVARLIAGATAPPLAALDEVARLSAAVPHAVLHLAPTALGAACAAIASAAVVRATASRRWMPGLVVAAAALTLAVWAPLVASGSGRLEVHLLDVGQGDAIAVRTPRGRWLLVDAGRRWDGGDAGRRTIIPYVRRYGGAVALFVMSHAHDDHVGGAASIVQALAPTAWWEPAFVTRSEAYRRALEAVRDTRGAWTRVAPGDHWQLDGVRIDVLAPDSAWTARQTDANETSVVLRIAYGSVAILLTGDAEAAEEAWMLNHLDPALLKADILKLGHHGSRTSSTEAFVDAVSPRIGLVSVGAGNRYGHPSPEVLAAFAARGIPLLRTDLEGTVIMETDGQVLETRIGRDRWRVPAR